MCLALQEEVKHPDPTQVAEQKKFEEEKLDVSADVPPKYWQTTLMGWLVLYYLIYFFSEMPILEHSVILMVSSFLKLVSLALHFSIWLDAVSWH